jgi:hypothetical protein
VFKCVYGGFSFWYVYILTIYVCVSFQSLHVYHQKDLRRYKNVAVAADDSDSDSGETIVEDVTSVEDDATNVVIAAATAAATIAVATAEAAREAEAVAVAAAEAAAAAEAEAEADAAAEAEAAVAAVAVPDAAVVAEAVAVAEAAAMGLAAAVAAAAAPAAIAAAAAEALAAAVAAAAVIGEAVALRGGHLMYVNEEVRVTVSFFFFLRVTPCVPCAVVTLQKKKVLFIA